MGKENNTFKWIGIYEVVSGMFGILLIIYAILVTTEIVEKNIVLMAVIGFLFYTLNVVAGVFLYQKNRIGVYLSIFVQILQLFSFSTETIKYTFCSGSFFGYGINNGTFTLKVEIFYVEYLLTFSNNMSPYFLVNFIPLIFLVLLIIKNSQNNK